MKNHLFKFGYIIGAIISIAFVTGGMFGLVDMNWLSPEGVGLAFAAGAVTGEASKEVVTTDVTTAKSSELLLTNIAKNITYMHPDKFPFDTIIRNMGIVMPIKAFRTEYYEVETRMLEDTVATTLAATTGDNGAAWLVHSLEVDNIHMWALDDCVLVQGINGSDSKDLALHVITVDTANSELDCIVLNGTGTNASDMPAIPEDTVITRMGNAKYETAAQTTPYTVFPQKEYNFAQIHMAQVEQSLYDKLHLKEVQWDLQEFRSEALWDLRGQMELTSLFGYRRYAYDSVLAQYKYFSHGMTRYITQSSSYAKAGFDNDDYIDMAKEIFTGNNGSETRVLFAGSGARATMAKAPTIQKQMNQRDVEVVWGVKFNRIETDFGTLLVKHHPLFNYAGWTDKVIQFDMNNIEKHVFKGLETNSVDFNEQAIRKTKGDIIDEAFCCALKNPDTHRIITFT